MGDWHNILVALSSRDEKEIYKVLYKKKVIDDKSPKLRTEDEKKMLKSLSYQMSKFPEKLIDGIQRKFPFLQRTPKTAEQRKEQVKECMRQKRALESEKEKEMRLNKQKEFELERYTQSPQFRAKKIRYEHDKRLAETEKEKEMRLNKQKEFDRERYTQSPQFRAKKVKEVSEKRMGETEQETERRLKKQKKYEHKRFSES